MRTTIRMDDHLLREAKAAAARTDRTLTQLIEDAVRAALAREEASRSEPVDLPTFGGGGTLPGVDLDDPSGLLALMEEERDTRYRG
jgi:hypothetical protein